MFDKLFFYNSYVQVSNLMGGGEMNIDETVNKLKETLEIVKTMNSQFKNPVSFVPVYNRHDTWGSFCCKTMLKLTISRIGSLDEKRSASEF